MASRTVWVLPDNLRAAYPVSDSSPSSTKGLLLECRARVSPVRPLYKSPEDNISTTGVREIELLRSGMSVRPSTSLLRQTTTVVSGSVTVSSSARVITRNSYVYLKKPTLVWAGPGDKSTELGDVLNPSIRVSFTGIGPATVYNDFAFGFRYVDAPSVYYTLSTSRKGGVPQNFETNWSSMALTTPVVEDRKINFAIKYRYSGTAIWYPYSGDRYVGASMSLNVDLNNHDPADIRYTPPDAYHDLTYTINDINLVSGYTTVNMPSWIIGPDGTNTSKGYQGFIEYQSDLAVLDSAYQDLTPWDNF